VSGLPVRRPSALVTADGAIAIAGAPTRFVSRGGDKLDGALARLGVDVAGRRWLDAGASTGGFTDRLLQGGADAVVTVDVGYGQLHWRLRNDARVVVLERVNVRHLRPEQLPWRPDGVVADLSFISLRTVLPALRRAAAEGADHLLLVKPQFEVGRSSVSRGGVVRDPALWTRALEGIVACARDLGLGLAAVAPAHPPGPAGNREFFVHLRAGAAAAAGAIADAVQEASA
jgi:23S rRNA (cytidine1920-2'-O)/16S rRNA (cytidine1409-2'-O)-methyltransferase